MFIYIHIFDLYDSKFLVFPKLPTKKKRLPPVNQKSSTFPPQISSWLHDARLSCQCHQRHWPQYYPWPCSTSSPPPAKIPWLPWWIHGTSSVIFADPWMVDSCFHMMFEMSDVSRGPRKRKNLCRHCQTMKILKFVFDGTKKSAKISAILKVSHQIQSST